MEAQGLNFYGRVSVKCPENRLRGSIFMIRACRTAAKLVSAKTVSSSSTSARSRRSAHRAATGMATATATNRYWRIEGFDSTHRIYYREIRAAQLGYNQVGPLLQALVAKAGLDFEEIVGAYAARRASIRNELLQVTSDPQSRFSCGTNPFFTAVLVRRRDVSSTKAPAKALQRAGSVAARDTAKAKNRRHARRG